MYTYKFSKFFNKKQPRVKDPRLLLFQIIS